MCTNFFLSIGSFGGKDVQEKLQVQEGFAGGDKSIQKV